MSLTTSYLRQLTVAEHDGIVRQILGKLQVSRFRFLDEPICRSTLVACLSKKTTLLRSDYEGAFFR